MCLPLQVPRLWPVSAQAIENKQIMATRSVLARPYLLSDSAPTYAGRQEMKPLEILNLGASPVAIHHGWYSQRRPKPSNKVWTVEEKLWRPARKRRDPDRLSLPVDNPADKRARLWTVGVALLLVGIG